MKRHSPQAVIAAGPPTPDMIRVIPVLEAPAALLPWSKLTGSLTFDLPEGGRVVMAQSSGRSTRWQQGHAATNSASDQLARQVP